MTYRQDRDVQLLINLRDKLADLHAARTLVEPEQHRAIAECDCDDAKEYRNIRNLLRDARSIRT